MTDRLLVDLGIDGRVSVSTWLDGELPAGGETFELVWPLQDDALEDLRWYLEDYLRAPFGVYGERGPRVEAALASWGEAVFSALFGAGPAREAYVRMRARPSPTEVVFQSVSPGLLGLPWELMADPDRATPLALEMAGVSRSLPVTDTAETVAMPAGRLRVLMVISRPAGTRDVGYRMIARPLLERLRSAPGDVDLVVLRPPTLHALGEALAAAAATGQPFQVVHFDGHGVFAGQRVAGASVAMPSARPAGQGVLIFERPGGGAEEVSASQVALVLGAAGVPLVVLNACQSGAMGKDLEAAVATRLLRAGVASVVAMAYNVYAVAAAEFMATFYERLLAGEMATAAVAAGRQRLFQRNRRPSPKGELPLADWMVPVHYLRRRISFPKARIENMTKLRPPDQVRDEHGALGEIATGSRDLNAVGPFFGRDDLFYQLEVALRLQRVAVVHGPGGTGKTELVKAFGRWWRDTGGVGRPEWVFWHSFEPGVASFGLDGVITQVGLRLFGNDFARLEQRKRRAILQDVLSQRRMLLIWDNFETVRSMPDPSGATGPLNEIGCQELQEFLGHLALHEGGAVVITSRTSEDWLGNVSRIRVGGLATHEATEYAENLLAPYPAAAPRRARRAFGELMQWLDGHPLSMRLILPRLDTTEPEELLKGLRGTVPLPVEVNGEEGRTTSFSASVSYSFTHLTKATRRLLPAVSLFHGLADANILDRFSQVSEVPTRFSGATKQDWEEALDDATRVGLLTKRGANLYRIHPALPLYLAAVWHREDPENHEAIREASIRALLVAYAVLGMWLGYQIRSGDVGLAYEIVDYHHRTLGSMLSYALEHGLWDRAQAIAEPLEDYWSARGLDEEADAWSKRARLAVENQGGTPPKLETDAGALWLFVTGNQAIRELAQHRLDDAEHTCQQILNMLQAQTDSPKKQRHLATAYHHFGSAAGLWGRLEDAEDWYRKSLAIHQEVGDQPSVASDYHHLGNNAERRGHLDEAEDWYRKSLAITEKAGDKPRMASSYHQLGMVAENRGLFDEAEGWYRRSLAISEEMGDRAGMAGTYHQLGITAKGRGQLDQAEGWYRKSLVISEEVGDKPLIAVTYFQLGIIAQDRGRQDEAEGWYRRSLAISEEMGDRAGMVGAHERLGENARDRGRLDEAEGWYRRSLAISAAARDQRGMTLSSFQLGIIAQDRGRLDEAEGWYRKSLAISEVANSKPGMALIFGQLGLLAEHRGQPRSALEWKIKCVAMFSEFPHPMTGPAPAHIARLTATLGMDALETSWQEITSRPLPATVRKYVESFPANGSGEKSRG